MIPLLDVVARAGGGGSSGGGGAGILLLPIILFSVIASWWVRKRLIAKAKKAQAKAEATDPSWSDSVIYTRVGKVFYDFQKDWSDFNFTHMKTYLTPRYYAHIELILRALQHRHRRNEMSAIDLRSANLLGVKDYADDELDRFDVEVNAIAVDKLINTDTGKSIHTDRSPFTELWHFEREAREWMLDSIDQPNSDKLVTDYTPNINRKYTEFAKANDFYYSADFGWLLLPLHGELFGRARFGHSDVNHHVIGEYNGVIMQLFEYVPIVDDKMKLRDRFRKFLLGRRRGDMTSYTVAHLVLPKSYAHILIDRRSVLSVGYVTPSNMDQISLEGTDFDKKFNVFTDDAARIASLELLDPAFMQALLDLPFEVNIEAMGTDLYLYTSDGSADYTTMLEILYKAYTALKL